MMLVNGFYLLTRFYYFPALMQFLITAAIIIGNNYL